jgi:hypothetical protein
LLTHFLVELVDPPLLLHREHWQIHGRIKIDLDHFAVSFSLISGRICWMVSSPSVAWSP